MKITDKKVTHFRCNLCGEKIPLGRTTRARIDRIFIHHVEKHLGAVLE